ncbi:MAG: SBBP repeat-containing protein [Acidobacteriota bacterium]|nr:SBBP repeat-containing protein [Acidobacteriota bacterium]
MRPHAIGLFFAFIMLNITTFAESPGLEGSPDVSFSGNLPLSFVPNRGQAPTSTQFQARGYGGTLSFKNQGVTLLLPPQDGSSDERDAAPVSLTLHFLDAGTGIRIKASAAQETRTHIYRGRDRSNWFQDLPGFGSITYRQIYPGIELTYEGTQGRLKSTWRVAPHADPGLIRWAYEGASGLLLDVESGGLLIDLSVGDQLAEMAPVAWTERGGVRTPVTCAYHLDQDGTVRFALGDYDRGATLVIDPILNYSTYLGGLQVDLAADVVVDGQGNAYVTGHTSSPNFPTSDGSSVAAFNDVFVTKINPEGNGVVYSVLIGGGGYEGGDDLALDAAGNLFVTGLTSSPLFPMLRPIQPLYQGNADAFVLMLDPTGRLVFSTFLGGAGRDEGKSIAADGAGRLYIAGQTASTNFPIPTGTALPGHAGLSGSSDAFLTRLDWNGSTLSQVYATYLGGSGEEVRFARSCALAVDGSGDVTMVGDTASPDFPVQNPLQGFMGGGNANYGDDLFVSKLSWDNVQLSLVYSTFLGGTGFEEGYGIAVDNAGRAYITGATGSADFPLAGSLQPVTGSFSDAFISCLSWNGAALNLDFSTLLGGSGDDVGWDLTLDSTGNVIVSGHTDSTDFPVANPIQSDNAGNFDAFVTRLAPAGSAFTLDFSTYLGGKARDQGYGVAVDAADDIYVTGQTQSLDFPLAGSAMQPTPRGSTDSFLTKIADNVSLVRCTENGDALPARGTLRVLLVFAEVDPSLGGGCSPIGSTWGLTGSIPADAGDYFDHILPGGSAPTGYITRYYHEGSMGQYLVLGDYYPDVISVPCNQNEARFVIRELNARHGPGNPFQTANGYGLDDFDTWDNASQGLPKTNFANNVVDVVAVIWANNPYIYQGSTWGCYSGFGVSYMLNEPLGDKTVRIAGSFNGCESGQATMDFFIAEYFHALFGGNHWHTASGAGKHTFPFISAGSYSVTAQSGSVSNTFAAWDRYHLGYRHPTKTHLLSALDPTLAEVPSDLTIQSRPGGGTFILRDFYTWGDAVRIKLPHVDWQTTGDVKNQYLWLENRQRLLGFDTSFWEGNPGKDPWEVGLYTQIQVGKDLKKGNNLYTSAVDHPNGLASWLLQLTAEGNHDFMYRLSETATPDGGIVCNWGNPNVPIDLSASLENPFTGFSDVYAFIDSDNDYQVVQSRADTRTPLGNGILLSGDGVQTGLSDWINGTLVPNCNYKGDRDDAFTAFQSGNTRLALDTNPSPTPMYTLRSNWGFNGPQPNIAGFENRTIWLNNLSIEILQENLNSNGDMLVDIRWDDPNVSRDVRWAGNLVLQDDPDDPWNRQTKIVLAPDTTICLDRGLSATQYYVNPDDGLFTEPTLLTVKSRVELETGAGIDAINGSRLNFEPGAVLSMQPGAWIRYQPLSDADSLTECGTALCVSAPRGLIGWWPFDETVHGFVADVIGGNRGDPDAGVSPTPGVVDGGLSLGNGQVTVPHHPSLDLGTGDVTFDFWLDGVGNGTILHKYDEVNDIGFVLYIEPLIGPPHPLVMDLNGSFFHPTNVSIQPNQWQHVAVVLDRTNAEEMRVYSNGRLAGTASLSGFPALNSLNNTRPLLIGGTPSGAGGYRGSIDELEIFNRALTQAEIKTLYEAGEAGKCKPDCCVPAPSGPTAWWSFDEPSGTVVHDIAGGFDGQINGVPVFTPGGPAEGYLAFDDVADYVDVPHDPGLDVTTGDFSIDFWINSRQTRGVVPILDKRVSSPVRGYHAYIYNGGVGFQLADGTFNNYTSTGFVADGDWHHVAITCDRSGTQTGTVYVDGQSVSSFDISLRSGSLANSGPLRFGTRSFQTNGQLKGGLDEFQLYHRVLEEREIRTIYAAKRGKCKESLQVPATKAYCAGDQEVTVPVTICNDSATPRQYLVFLQGLPAGTGCSQAGPTEFTFLDPSEITVPAMSCETLEISVARPGGLTAHGTTVCYEATAYNLETGSRLTATGRLQAQITLCVVVSNPTGEGNGGQLLMALTNNSGTPRNIGYTVSATRPELFSFNGRGAEGPLTAEVELAADTTTQIEIPVDMVGFDPVAQGQFLVEIDDEGILLTAGAPFTIDPRPLTPGPPDLALTIITENQLVQGQAGSHVLRIRNNGGETVNPPFVVNDLLPDRFLEATGAGSGWSCGLIDGTLRCDYDGPPLEPGDETNITVDLQVDFGGTINGLSHCAELVLDGELALEDNQPCLFRDVAAREFQGDLGDAPDSSNHTGREDNHHETRGSDAPPQLQEESHTHFRFDLDAYPDGTEGRFPTVYDPETGEAPGPIHWMPRADAWLGTAVSLEFDADIGSDEDPTVNLIIPGGGADHDGADDGVDLDTLGMPTNRPMSFDVTVTVVGEAQTRYLNVWFDFDRDGYWGDDVSRGAAVPEWAVVNHPTLLGPGVHQVILPDFETSDPPDAANPMWLRITLSETPAPAEGDGRGPVFGYRYGETEDYYLDTFRLPVEILPEALQYWLGMGNRPVCGDASATVLTYIRVVNNMNRCPE